MLRSLCNCCVFKVFDFILAPECRMCVIRKGIVCIANEGKKDISDCGEMQTPVEQPKGRLEEGRFNHCLNSNALKGQEMNWSVGLMKKNL